MNPIDMTEHARPRPLAPRFAHDGLVLLAGLGVLATLVGCEGSTASTGTLQLNLKPEASITDGVEAGTAMESILDGWTLTYSQFLATVGNARASVSTDPSLSVSDPTVRVFDMRGLSSLGFPVGRWEGLDATLWDRIGYDIPAANADTLCADGVDPTACDTMRTEGLSYWIKGQISQPTMTPVTFDWKIAAGEGYDQCTTPDGSSGIAVAAGGTTQADLVIHGDHFVFSRYPTGDESLMPIYRCAQWIANADGADGSTPDNNVTMEELQAFSAADAFPTMGDAAMCHYDLGQFPDPVNTAWDYMIQMMRSLGHFQGEGDCQDRHDL